LHIGAGQATAAGVPDQAFAATQQFIDFLHTIKDESERDNREIELIINGDMFAFLQVPAVDNFDPKIVYPASAFHDSSQEASVKRLNIIVQRNTAIFDALSDFIHVENPQRRITIIKGNHDISLFWPGVKTRLRELLGASGARASLLRFADEFVSREQIYVEHGHQRAEKMNGYQDSFDPRAATNPTQLHYPAGSRFTIDFLNGAKSRWWFVDHIKPATALIWYALHWNFDFACDALVSFIRHTPSLVVNDLELGSQTLVANPKLLRELESREQRDQLARNYAASPAFRREFHRLVQQYLGDATIDNKGEAAFRFVDISDDPLEMGQADQQRQRAMLNHAAQLVAAQERAKVILFGHSHFPVFETLPNGCTYINTGSWTRDLSNAAPETWRALFSGTLAPADVPPTLPYARIEYDDHGTPSARLLTFNGPSNSNTETTGNDRVAKKRTGSKSFLIRTFPRISRLLGASDHPS